MSHKKSISARVHTRWRAIIKATRKERHVIERMIDSLLIKFTPCIMMRNKKNALNIIDKPLPSPVKDYIAHSVSLNLKPQLLIDVSGLIRAKQVTGVQRVGRSILLHLLQHPSTHLRVQPVYMTKFHGYKYAHRFTLKLLGHHNKILKDVPAVYGQDDVFWGLNCSYKKVAAEHALFQNFRDSGLKTSFLVHDLLPVLMPENFHADTTEIHVSWLKSIIHSDQIVCVSKATADSLTDWIKKNTDNSHLPRISWFHLGSDIDNSISSSGLPENMHLLSQMHQEMTFLLIGTIEPRKGHRQTLAAFELLWQEHNAINLVFVGQEGWMMESFINELKAHPQYGIHLFWIDNASDEYLRKLYQTATCLLFPSEGEGFGLPIIEAAQYGLPLLLRNLAVFREIAGKHASYFSGNAAVDLVQAIKQWISQYEIKQIPDSAAMPRMTWGQSTEQLLSLIAPV